MLSPKPLSADAYANFPQKNHRILLILLQLADRSLQIEIGLWGKLIAYPCDAPRRNLCHTNDIQLRGKRIRKLLQAIINLPLDNLQLALLLDHRLFCC